MKAMVVKNYQPVILFIVTVSVASVFSLIGVDPHHQGVMFKPALDVAHGQMLFRDTCTQYGAFTTLLQAWALRIFGDYLAVIQIQTAVFYGLISVCLWYVWNYILPRWLSLISVLIWLLLAPYFMWIFLPWASVSALFFQLFSFLLLLKAMSGKRRLMMTLAGSIGVLAFWCRQPTGIFHCAALMFFLATVPAVTGRPWKDAVKDCAFLGAGMLAGSMPFFLWLFFNGALHDMWLQSVKWAFFFAGQKHGEVDPNKFLIIVKNLLGFHPWFKSHSFYSFIWTLFPILCIGLSGILVVRLYRTGAGADKKYLPLYGILLVSLASWLQYFPRPDIRHCYWAATPMIGLLSYAAWQFCIRFRKNLQIPLVCLILAAVFGWDIETRIASGLKKISDHKTVVEEPKVLRGMYVTPEAADTYKAMSESLNNAIQRNPAPYLINRTSDPLYLAFVGPQYNYHPMCTRGRELNISFYPDYKPRTIDLMNTKHPLILWYEGVSIPGWKCTDVFNTTDFAHLHNDKRRLALYQFRQ